MRRFGGVALASVLVLAVVPAWAQQVSTTVTFRNNSQGTARLYWLNGDNQEQLYGTLNPGESGQQQTYTTHVWIVRDADGKQLNRVTIDASTRVILALPGDSPDRPNTNTAVTNPNPNPESGPQSLAQQARAAAAYLNQVRANPRAFSSNVPKQNDDDDFARVYVDLGNIQARPALAWNDILARVAEEKAQEMANETTQKRQLQANHVSSNGEGINIRMFRAGYAMPQEWTSPPSTNYFENLGTKFDQGPSPANLGPAIINQLINDNGLPDNQAGHRNAILGSGQFYATMIDVGIGLARVPEPKGNGGYYFIMVLVLGKHQF
jgi:hypothetical protein